MKVWKDAYKAREPGTLSINLLASLLNLQTIRLSTMEKKDSAFAYLVISPNPQLGNFISTGDGVEIGGKVELGYRKSSIHYVKVGHQCEIKGRFRGYNTHNPSSKYALVSRSCQLTDLGIITVWFRHFGFEKRLAFETKSANLKKYPMNLADSSMNLTEESTSADYITKRLLKGRVDPAARANEWYVEANKLNDFKKLCDALDDMMKAKGTVKGENKLEGDMNIFDNEEECIENLEAYGKLFAK